MQTTDILQLYKLPYGNLAIPSAATTNTYAVYFKASDGGLYKKDDLGNEFLIAAGGGGGGNVSTAGLTANTLTYADSANSILSLSAGTSSQVLHGNAIGIPTWSSIVESDISLSNNTTNNVSTSKHGFTPILPNVSTQFLNGQGNWTTPSGVTSSYITQSFTTQTSINVVHNFGAYPVIQVLDNTGAVLIPMGIVNNTLNDFTVTFSSNHTGIIIASVGSPQPQSVISVSSNYTVTVNDRIVKVTAAAVTITLPTAVGNTGREYIINNASSGSITLNTTSSQTISNVLTQTLPSISSITVYSDGANYWII